MDYEKQVQKHNSKIWDILMLSEFNEHWLGGLASIIMGVPDNNIKTKMITAYENDSHKYKVVDNHSKLLFIHYFRYVVYGKTGFNWSSFVRLMEKLLITDYPTKKVYDEYYLDIFKKEGSEKNTFVYVYSMTDDSELSDSEFVDKHLPQKDDWFVDGVEDTFEYKTERLTTLVMKNGKPLPPFMVRFDKIDERSQMWLKLCDMRPSLRSDKEKKDLKWLEDNK
tara:strand:+ start:10023 stop:10691 length:669 start_codon:yes stop_codon:yes gene_type:complete